MKFFSCVTLLALLTGCASNDPWTRDDTVLEGIYLATVVADGVMTAKIQDHPNIIENGLIARHALGRNPSSSSVWQYFATVAITHYLISRALPKGWRSLWQGAGIVRHARAVNKGHQIGTFSEPCTTPLPAEFSCAP